MKVNDGLIGVALVVLGLIVLWHIQSFPPMPGQQYGPAWFPGLIAIGLAVCGALLIVVRFKSTERAPLFALPDWTRRARPLASVAAVIIGLVAYIVVVDTVGFHLTAIALLLVWSRLLGASWRLAVPVALAATIVIHLSFYKLLKVPLPWGCLERFAF